MENDKDGWLINLRLVTGYVNVCLTMTNLFFSFLYFSVFSGVESPVKKNDNTSSALLSNWQYTLFDSTWLKMSALSVQIWNTSAN